MGQLRESPIGIRIASWRWIAPLLVLALSTATALAASAPQRPFPQHVAYAAGTIAPNQRTQTQLDDDVRAAYERWMARYLVQAGTESDGHPRYRVLHGSLPSDSTVSEGQGYGLLLTAIMAGYDSQAQSLFDGLWEYFNDHRSEIDGRLMDWLVPANEQPNPPEGASAFDGDADIAYGLLLADSQWGSAGRIDYRAQALDVLAGILASEIGPASRLPMLGDWVGEGDETYNEWTVRSSDFMNGHFRAYARATANSTWSQVVAAIQQTIASLQSNYSPATGLLPDFTVPTSAGDTTPRPAPPYFLESAHDGAFFYNAGRDPWRIATDGLLNDDATSLAQARKMAQWAAAAGGGDPATLRAGYALDGTPLPDSDYLTSFFVSPFGVAAMADPALQEFLNAVWETVRARQEDYYEDSVTLLSLLVMSRNFWDPTLGSGPPACSGDSCLYLNDDRFRAQIDWRDYAGATGNGHGVELTPDSGLFWFFNATNLEFLVKILDGCGVNGRYWVYAAGTTDVEYTLWVTDTQTSEVRSYSNPLGTASPAITDSTAFATCP